MDTTSAFLPPASRAPSFLNDSRRNEELPPLLATAAARDIRSTRGGRLSYRSLCKDEQSAVPVAPVELAAFLHPPYPFEGLNRCYSSHVLGGSDEGRLVCVW